MSVSLSDGREDYYSHNSIRQNTNYKDNTRLTMKYMRLDWVLWRGIKSALYAASMLSVFACPEDDAVSENAGPPSGSK
jgi:hypothetical protein